MATVDWNMISELRQTNKENANYPVVFWNGDNLLYVKIGDQEISQIAPYEALNLFGDNELFLLEYCHLTGADFESVSHEEDKKIAGLTEQQVENVEESMIVKMQQEIKDEIASVIQKLDLEKTDDVMKQLENCCKVHAYIACSNTYDSSVMKKKQTYPDHLTRFMDLYNGLVQHYGVCTSNSIAFQEILSRIGITVECVALTSKQGGYHMANLVLLAGDYYFFDTTAEGYLYKEHAKDKDELVLHYAGLGTDTYCEWYHPEGIMPLNPLDSVLEFPDNIAEGNIPFEIVNSVFKANEMNESKYNK